MPGIASDEGTGVRHAWLGLRTNAAHELVNGPALREGPALRTQASRKRASRVRLERTSGGNVGMREKLSAPPIRPIAMPSSVVPAALSPYVERNGVTSSRWESQRGK